MVKANRFKRLWQHWQYPLWRVTRYFPTQALRDLGEHIGLSERYHRGEIRFVVEARLNTATVLSGLDTRSRALQWFGELGVWDTAENCGVLVYVLFADRAVEVVADRGIAAKVPHEEWQAVCNTMQVLFQQGDFTAGLTQGLQQVNQILCQHFPADGTATVNELPNEVILR